MKKVLILVLFCFLAAALFASGSAAKPAGSANEITLTVVNRVNSEIGLENNPMLQYIREKHGFNIILEAPPINNYNERLQIIMASGDLPDLLYTWGFDQNYVNWAEQGLIHPVDDLVKTYPNIMHNVTPDMFHSVSLASNGKAYAVPRTNKVNRWGYQTNVAWLAKLGVKAPATLDEFYEYGKLVRDGDPDGNGQADTFLISPDGGASGTGTVGSAVTFITNAFFPPTSAPDFDGVYKIRERRSGYYPWLDYMRKLYAEKITDPEYIVNKTYGSRDKVYAKRVAAVDCHDSNIPQDNIANNNGAFDFLDFFPPLQATNGTVNNYVAPAVWGGWMLPTSSNKTQDALRFLDWGNSPEGFDILYNGVPGLTYTSYDINSRSIVQTEEQRTKWTTVTSSYMVVSFAYEGVFPYCSNDPKMNDYYNKSLANYLSVVTDIETPSVKNIDMDKFNQDNPDLVTQLNLLENNYVTGAISRAELENFINNQWLPRIATAEATYKRLMAER